MAFEIITYGGGEILQSLFNSIAMLFNHKDGIVNPLLIISTSVGALMVVTKAYFSPDASAILVRFFLTLIAIIGLVLMPPTNVIIKDNLTDKAYAVGGIPSFFAYTAGTIATVGSNLTTAIEKAMHTPNDPGYNSTGMIFGSEMVLDISRYKISNAVLEQNLKRFAKQCVFYDLALNKYSLDELKKTANLWEFLAERSSKVRMIPYTDPSESGEKKRQTANYLTCRQAVAKMTEIFEKEKSYHAKQDLVKNLPLTYQALSGLQASKEDLISQQLMMNVLSGEFNGDQFAKTRAAAQQKSTYLVLGSLAANSVITLRAVLEAIIYSAIIFVIPLSTLPAGISYVTNWLWLTIWIQLWPPFFAIIHYIMQIAAKGKGAAIFSGLTSSEQGLSFFTSVGLTNLHEDLFAVSGYLAASIPFISYAIIKGGASSFMHLAGSMMTPAHSAATSAAGEQISGSYNLANSSFGQLQYENSTGFQRNVAPSLSQGYYTENQGNLSTTYAAGEMVLKQANSDLRVNLSTDDSITNAYQNMQQNADSFTHSHQKNYSESISSHGRNMSDLTRHMAQSENYSEGISQRDAFDVQESARKLESTAASFAGQHGISERDGMALLCSTKQLSSFAKAAPVIGDLLENLLPTGTSDSSTSKEALVSSALNTANSEDFSTNYQKVCDFATSTAHNTLDDQGVRLAEGVTRSLDEVSSAQEQFQTAITHSDQVSESLSWAQQNSYFVRSALNQDFVNWASDKIGPEETRRVLVGNCETEIGPLITEFITDVRESHSSALPQGQFQDPQLAFSTAQLPTIDKEETLKAIHADTGNDFAAYGLSHKDLGQKGSELSAALHQTEGSIDHSFQSSRSAISEQKDALTNLLQHKSSSGVADIWDRSSACSHAGEIVQETCKWVNNRVPLGWTTENKP